ncbi:hypothetical protein EJ110_NYTH50758 [Nymphaea thermarum]|nr:hypothetical protein EJ110_NYTH50758 [Nymphaea thermarum]
MQDFRDDWWLQIDGEPVGYWPSSLFVYLNFWANTTLYGGQIYNTVPGGYHTLTQMGSGRFADEGYGRSCLISHIQYVNGDRKFKRLPDAAIVEDRPECYSLVYIGEDYLNKYGQFLYNGGPGLSLDCIQTIVTSPHMVMTFYLGLNTSPIKLELGQLGLQKLELDSNSS